MKPEENSNWPTQTGKTETDMLLEDLYYAQVEQNNSRMEPKAWARMAAAKARLNAVMLDVAVHLDRKTR